MESNLRILQSFKKINEKINDNEEKQKEINRETDDFIKDISKKIKEIDNENQDLKKELSQTIEKVKREKPKDGKDGKDGRDGKDGYTPVKGKDYFDGKDGADGLDGKNGVDGKNGKDGQDGRNGIDGKDGKNGIGIYNIEININGELIIVLTDKRKINCGVVVGRDGFGYNGNDGVSVTDAKIIDGELVITLSTGRKINAGKIVGEGGTTIEIDPVFTKSPAYSITNQNIENWNNKVEDSNYIHTDNNFTNEYIDKINSNEQNISDLDNNKADKTELEKITPKIYTAKLDLEGVLLETNVSYESIAKDIENNTPINLLAEWNNEQISMNIAEIKYDVDVPYFEFMAHVRNADSSFLFWFYVQSDGHKYCEIKSVDNELLMLNASFNESAALISTNADYATIEDAVLKGKEVIIQTTWHYETIYMRLGEWKAGYTPKYFSFYGLVRDGYLCKEFFLHIGQNGEHTFSDNRTYQMKDEQVQTITGNENSENTYPSSKAVAEYANERAGIVLDYMQTTFADNILTLAGLKRPVPIYYNAEGFEASNSNVGDDWHLTGLDLSPYKRLKFYVKSAGSTNDNYTPSHIVEMYLDPNSKSYKDFYVAGHTSQNPNNANRLHNVTFAVNAEKTAVQFARATSLYGTASTASKDGRNCYLIEGYYD
jgi:hypothetical protein